MPAALASVSLSPSSVVGGTSPGNSSNVAVLNGPAPPGGAVIALSSSNPAVASVQAQMSSGSSQLAPYLLYPIGFIAVIIGRAQLFTENTLYPVILVLDERKHVLRTLRLWGIVFAANVMGALLFALLAVKSAALRPGILAHLIDLGKEASFGTGAHFFWSGVIGGWLIALVAWTVTASHWTIGPMAIIYLLTLVVGI